MKQSNLPVKTSRSYFLLFLLLFISQLSCSNNSDTSVQVVSPHQFDTIINNKQVELYTLKNEHGRIAQFTNLGARWVSMWVPDKNGTMIDVVLGFNSVNDYLNSEEPYHGAVVGRICGRINNATFILGDTSYQLAHNDGFGKPKKNHLHGGVNGFHLKIWDVQLFKSEKNEQGIKFNYISPDREEGFPGLLNATVSYLLTNQNEIKIAYTAKTDEPTIVNMTNHAYFNLNGEGNGNILNHQLKVYSEKYIECDRELIPTGKLIDVDGSPLDYRDFAPMGRNTAKNHSQIFNDIGYAAAMVIKEQNNNEMVKVAEAVGDLSSVKLQIISDQVSLQLYNAWLFTGNDMGKGGKPYPPFGGFIMETQGYPDAPNNPHFPSIQLNPGEVYSHNTIFRFSINN